MFFGCVAGAEMGGDDIEHTDDPEVVELHRSGWGIGPAPSAERASSSGLEASPLQVLKFSFGR